MDLFLDTKGLEKLAASMARLSENPNDWQAEIINELYKQAPFVGEFRTRIIINEQDSERRYAIGAVEVTSRESENTVKRGISSSSSGTKRVLIPLIINEGKMFPLDTFIVNGKAQPLAEDRFRRAMFRPNLFEGVATRPGDQDMMSILYPPHRLGGVGVGGTNSRVYSKTSSRRMILDEIKDTLTHGDVRTFMEDFSGDVNLHSKLAQNEAVREAVRPLMYSNFDTSTPKEMLKQAAFRIRPKVIQVIDQQNGLYRIKTANPNSLIVEENEVDRPTLRDTIGADMVRTVDEDGSITLSTDPVVKDSLVSIEVKPIDQFGQYRVKTLDGKELLGYAFPFIIDLDGTTIDMKVFTNGSESGLQEQMAGVFVGKSPDLPDKLPEGFGCFYYSTQAGATAIMPMDVANSILDQGVQTYSCSTPMGESVQIRKVPGLKMITQIEPNVYGLPMECGFLPLPNIVPISEDADSFMKTAAVRAIPRRAEVMYESGGTFTVRGAEVEKIAKVHPVSMTTQDEALFNLTLLGLPVDNAMQKIAQARSRSEWVPIDGVRPITLFGEVVSQAKTAASQILSRIPDMKVSLVKEAAYLDDPLSVDKVLSLGFLNPENIGTFISYLPEFEETLGKLSELLIASRLGLSVVDTGALERVTKHLDKVIRGLRELAQHPSA